MPSWRIPLPDVEGAQLRVQGKGKEGWVISSSANDVPRYMDVRVDEATHRLWIHFTYLDREESRVEHFDKDFTVLIGVNSGKLLGLEARNLSKSRGEIVVSLVKAVERQIEHATRDNQRLNYGMIKDVVQNRVAPLLAGA